MELGHIIDNLKDVLSQELGNKRVYDKDVAEALGISKESLSHMKRRNSIPYEAIVYFCAKRSLSINWILFDQIPTSLEEKTEKFARIKYFKELHTSAGGGAWNDEEGFDYMYIDYEGLNSISHFQWEHLHAINVIGDSMEPTLSDKEIVVCDVTCKEIMDGNIYIINTPNSGLLIKRLTCRDEKLSILSDNRQYLDEVVNIRHENIHVLGRVLGTLVER